MKRRRQQDWVSKKRWLPLKHKPKRKKAFPDNAAKFFGQMTISSKMPKDVRKILPVVKTMTFTTMTQRATTASHNDLDFMVNNANDPLGLATKRHPMCHDVALAAGYNSARVVGGVVTMKFLPKVLNTTSAGVWVCWQWVTGDMTELTTPNTKAAYIDAMQAKKDPLKGWHMEFLPSSDNHSRPKTFVIPFNTRRIWNYERRKFQQTSLGGVVTADNLSFIQNMEHPLQDNDDTASPPHSAITLKTVILGEDPAAASYPALNEYSVWYEVRQKVFLTNLSEKDRVAAADEHA